MGWPRRSRHRHQPDAQPPRRDGRRRDRAGSRGGGARHAQNASAEAGCRRASIARWRLLLDFTPADAHLCPAFALRLVRGVHNGASPDWMQRRLRAIGLRPINALVDVTNYITFDRGRPLHVFDAAKVKGALRVRRARAGESVLALDGKTYALDASMVVIADDGGVELIAGIMGGEHSGCDENTRDVLIESALWDPLNIAQTGRKLGIVTDARYRFERGVDPDFCVPGAELATRLIMDLCGGEPSRLVVAGDPTKPRKVVDFPYSEVRRLTGFENSAGRGRGDPPGARLRGEGRQGDRAELAARHRRQGRHRRADRAHRRARQGADDAFGPPRLRRAEAGADAAAEAHAPRQTRARRARPARGGDVVVHLETGCRAVRRRRAGLGARQSDRGRSLGHAAEPRPRPRRGRRAQRAARIEGRRAVRGRQIFLGDGENDERIAAAALRRGRAKRGGEGRHWTGSGAVDVFDAKGDALALLAALGVAANAVQIISSPAFLHPASWRLAIRPKAMHFFRSPLRRLEPARRSSNILPRLREQAHALLFFAAPSLNPLPSLGPTPPRGPLRGTIHLGA